MPSLTSAQIKNFVRRAFREVVDPGPDKSAVSRIWTHFESRCCYCDRQLNRAAKEGHIDHLISASKGGTNQVGNRVLSCPQCNEKEKLDRDWREFLNDKCPQSAVLAERVARIEAWRTANTGGNHPAVVGLVNEAARMAGEVNQLIDEKFVALRRLHRDRRNAASQDGVAR